jgi:proton glutamate symport protein
VNEDKQKLFLINLKETGARMNIRKVLTDPKTVLGGVVAGFVIGLFFKPLGEALLPIGTIYISFLSMCLLPILITAIVGGVGRLLRNPSTRGLFKPIAFYYLVGLLIPCAAGILTAVIFGPGRNLGPEAERSIGALIVASPATAKESGGILDFIAAVVPVNIFEALSTNQVMGIVFASLVIGLSMGMIKARATDDALALVEAAYETFMLLFRWAVVILAPGLLCIVAGVVAQIDPETLIALTKFVWLFYLGGIVLMIAYLALFWFVVRGSFVGIMSNLGNPNMLAFMTNNPIVALPITLETLERRFGVDRHVPDTVIPFGIFANQHGAVYLLSFLTVFLAQVYAIDLGVQDYAVIALGSILAGSTAVGGGALLIPTIAPILGAVGIPTAMALVVLATTDNIIGPMRTVLTLQSNITLTVMTARPGKELPHASESGSAPASKQEETS